MVSRAFYYYAHHIHGTQEKKCREKDGKNDPTREIQDTPVPECSVFGAAECELRISMD